MSIHEIFTILDLGLIYGITALGIYLTLRIVDYPDLTCEGSFILGPAVTCQLLLLGYDPVISTLSSIISGGISGIFTYGFHKFFGVDRLLSGILSSSMLFSINMRIMNNSPNLSLYSVKTIFTNEYFNSTWMLLGLTICILIVLGLLMKTDFGLAIRAVGFGKNLSHILGIQYDMYVAFVLFISNGLISFSGSLAAQYHGFFDITQGVGILLLGVCAISIGEKMVNSRSVVICICAVILGSIAYRIFIDLALYSNGIGLRGTDLYFITGILILTMMKIRRNNEQ